MHIQKKIPKRQTMEYIHSPNVVPGAAVLEHETVQEQHVIAQLLAPHYSTSSLSQGWSGKRYQSIS